MSDEPQTADEFAAAAFSRPGLVEGLNAGSIDAFVDYLELAPGAEVESIASRHLAASASAAARPLPTAPIALALSAPMSRRTSSGQSSTMSSQTT